MTQGRLDPHAAVTHDWLRDVRQNQHHEMQHGLNDGDAHIGALPESKVMMDELGGHSHDGIDSRKVKLNGYFPQGW